MTTPKLATEKLIIEKWGNQRFGSFQTKGLVKKASGGWTILCVCDCGKVQFYPVAKLLRHTDCKCTIRKKVQYQYEKAIKHIDLEEIWPTVIAAGRSYLNKKSRSR